MPPSPCVLALFALLVAAPLAGGQRRSAASPQRPTYAVYGRVVDEAGQPVAGVKVAVMHEMPDISVHTDNAGRFVMHWSPGRVAMLQLHATDEAHSRQAFAELFVRDATELPAEIILVLRPPREIAVTVVDGDKRPIVGARVLASAGWRATWDSKTDSAGNAVLHVPADAALDWVFAVKRGVGADYYLYRVPGHTRSDPYHLNRDDAQPITLVLNGTRRVTLKVIDQQGRPMQGVAVGAGYFEKPRKGGHYSPYNIEEYEATTDADGNATFDTIPVDCSSEVRFFADADGFYAPESLQLEPGSEAAEVAVTLARLVLVRGQVLFNDGRAASGVKVEASGDGYDSRHFHGSTVTDERGRFELAVQQNEFYVFAASLGKWATPLATQVIFKEPPRDEIRLVLEKATRVFGRATIGEDRQPLCKGKILLVRQVEDAYLQLPEVQRLPNPNRAIGARNFRPRLSLTAGTDEQGRFEIFSGPGDCSIAPPGHNLLDRFTLNGEAEWEVNLHVDGPLTERFAGRVVLRDDPRQGVSEASVTGWSGWLQFRATTLASGSFQFDREPQEMLVYAHSADGALAGIKRVGPNDSLTIVPVAPAASAHGRLLDAASQQPLKGVEVEYFVCHDDSQSWGRECGGTLKTDKEGVFHATGLVPGWTYQFHAINEKSARHSSDDLSRITPERPGSIDMGDFRVDPGGKAKRALVGPIMPPSAPKIFGSEADSGSQVAAALKKAKAEKKRVLLVFGANWSAACHRLNACFNENEEVSAVLRAAYVVVLINVENWQTEGHNSEIAKDYGSSTSLIRLPSLMVLNAEGEQLVGTGTEQLEHGELRYAQQILAFLDRSKRDGQMASCGGKGAALGAHHSKECPRNKPTR